jgi:hypothetical protein
MILASSSTPLGGHLWHLIALVVPLLIALVVVLVERLRPSKDATDAAERPAARAVLTADAFGQGGRVPSTRVQRRESAA